MAILFRVRLRAAPPPPQLSGAGTPSTGTPGISSAKGSQPLLQINLFGTNLGNLGGLPKVHKRLRESRPANRQLPQLQSALRLPSLKRSPLSGCAADAARQDPLSCTLVSCAFCTTTPILRQSPSHLPSRAQTKPTRRTYSKLFDSGGCAGLPNSCFPMDPSNGSGPGGRERVAMRRQAHPPASRSQQRPWPASQLWRRGPAPCTSGPVISTLAVCGSAAKSPQTPATQ